jgi:arylsulfatase A-like enzyme
VGTALATALLLAGGCSPQPPNVVIYLVDTLRQDHLGLYGYECDTSPRLGEFAKDAVVYRAAYSPTSWTKPAVTSLLSGRYPSAHGAVKRDSTLDADVQLVGEYLREAGYQTAAFVTNPNVLPVWGFERGFDRFYDIESVARSARADRVNEVVFEHLAQDPREPFLLYVHTRDPHKPYAPPVPYARMWAGEGDARVAAYDGEIRFNDHHFGRLLDHLEAAGLYRDALIVFTSDHGEELGERG